MRYTLMPVGATLMLLLIATPQINLAYSSLQQEISMPSIVTILIQDNFSDNILFEYGAESGELQPPWDFIGANGNGVTTGAGIDVDSTRARTGTESMKIYQPSPPKSDTQRRVGAKYWSHTSNEFYASWWTYFPSSYDTAMNFLRDTPGEWITHGGLKNYWGNPEDDGYRWSKGLRLAFSLDKDATGFHARGTWSGNDRTGEWVGKPSWVNGDKVYLSYNTWVHFQLYIKKASNGTVTAWIDDAITLNITNTPTDPAYWSEPEAGDLWARNEYYPIIVEQYGSQSLPALELWVDDVVVASEKVPENYGVKGQ